MADPAAVFARSKSVGTAGQFPRAAALAAEAAGGYGQAGDHANAVVCQVWQARMLQQSGKLLEAEDTLRVALGHCDHRGLPNHRLDVLTELGATLELAGNTAEAIAAHREVLALSRQVRQPIKMGIACANIARLLPRMALPERRGAAIAEARALLREAGRVFTALAKPRLAGNVLITLGDLERTAGNLLAARAALTDASTQAAQSGDSALAAAALLNLGYTERDLGDNRAASQHFGQSRVQAQRCNDRLADARAQLAEALLGSDAMSPQDAIVAFAAVEAAFVAIGHPQGALPATANRAAALSRTGRLADAARLLGKVHGQLKAAAERLGAAEIGLSLAELALARGDSAQCEKLIAQAVADRLPERLAHRLALLQARRAARSLDIAGCQAAVLEALHGEPTRGTRFSAALLQAQLDLWLGKPTALDALRGLAQQAAEAPRESAAVQSALADALAWTGQTSAAAAAADRARAQWAALEEAAGVAGAALTSALCARPANAAAGALAALDLAAVREFADLTGTVAAATALSIGDGADWQAACQSMHESGNLAGQLWMAWVGAQYDPTQGGAGIAVRLARIHGIVLPKLALH